MTTFKDIAILDITEREYGGHISSLETRLYIDMDDLPWDPDTEEFWDDEDNDAWDWWKDEVMKHLSCKDIVKIEFKVLQSWNDKLDTFFVKEF